MLPVSVLEKAQAEILDFQGCGMSVMEMSHRSKEFEGIIQTAEADLRELMNIPANYKVLFLQGGASLQFAMIPMNLRPAGASADYIVTGAWSRTAAKEAAKLGATHTAFTSEADNFSRLPADNEIQLDPNAAYVHFCHNETIHGVEFKTEPRVPAGVPLICDMSSDFLSQPVDVSPAMIYAGAQKMLALLAWLSPSSKSCWPRARKPPVMLDYKIGRKRLALQHPAVLVHLYRPGDEVAQELGGLPAIHAINQQKANLIYEVHRSAVVTTAPCRPAACPSERALPHAHRRTEELFKEAKKAIHWPQGSPPVGGLQASICACPSICQSSGRIHGRLQRKNG